MSDRVKVEEAKSLVENSVSVLDGGGILLEGFVRRFEAGGLLYRTVSNKIV